MSDDGQDQSPPTDRESPVGAPVIRGDPTLTGEHAEQAVAFDPEDPESLALAAETVAAFAMNTAGADDNVVMLRGAAACAALVRGEGSYKAAAKRAGEDVTVSFIRKWSRVHDLPQSIRRHVARGDIAPTAAKHIARVSGEARLHLGVPGKRLRARQGDAIMEYMFGGRDGVLLEKRHLTDGWLWDSLKWKVNYYEYQQQDGYLYARGVVLYNADYHYRLIITRRDITFEVE